MLRQLCGSRSRRAGCLEAGWIYGNAGNALLRLDSAGGVAAEAARSVAGAEAGESYEEWLSRSTRQGEQQV